MTFRSGLAVLAVCIFTFTACAEDDHGGSHALAIKATSMPLATGEEAAHAIGKLLHRGSLRLTADDGHFGGLSGLIVSDDGSRFLAITDASHWVTGELQYRDGKLTGVVDGEIGHLVAPDGSLLRGKEGDAEGLAGSLTGNVYVSFEGDHRVWRYDFAKSGMKGAPVNVPVPADLRRAESNRGLEAITVLADGRLLAMTESFRDDKGNIRGWLLAEGADPQPISLKRRAPFDLTDIRQLPNGDLLTLERRFSTAGGVGFEMRRIAKDQIVADGVMDGDVLADAGMNFIIDNMEGLSLRKDDDGKQLVYIVSDDNFNAPLQQTLLMMFELKE